MTQVRANDPLSMVHARKIAYETLGGDYDLLHACSDLAKLKEQLPGVSDETMDIFIGVASEIDDLPIGTERSY